MFPNFLARYIEKELPSLEVKCQIFEQHVKSLSSRYYLQLGNECQASSVEEIEDLKEKTFKQHSPFCPKHPSGILRPSLSSLQLSKCLSVFGPKFLCGFYDPDSNDKDTPPFPHDSHCTVQGHVHEWKDGFEFQFLKKDIEVKQVIDSILGYLYSLRLSIFIPSSPTTFTTTKPPVNPSTFIDSLTLPTDWPLYFYNPVRLTQFLCPEKVLNFKRIQKLSSLSNHSSHSPGNLWLQFFSQFSLGIDAPREENALAFLSFFYFFNPPPSTLIFKSCHVFIQMQKSALKYFLDAMVKTEKGHSRDQGSAVLGHLVKIFNDYITKTCEITNLEDERITDAVKALASFNEINMKYDLIPISAFYNATVNELLNIRQDFPKWKSKEGFSYCAYPFILNTSTKSLILRIENMIQMRHELQNAFFKSMFIGPQTPYLELIIHRDNLIRDTIFQLQSKSVHDLRKQLRVRFIDEPGVDEGGVQKEFFHLIIKDLFKEEYGMFKVNHRVRWFRANFNLDKDVLEEFELVGKLIGLAIYNAVFLDLHFPLALYKKLTDECLYLKDFKEIYPDLAKGLEALALFDGDVSTTYMRCFEIDIEQLDGSRSSLELCPGGKDKLLTNENRNEYIKLCLEYYLNKSIQCEFEAFKRGFDLVTRSSAIRLFRAEELLQLLVGESHLDFHALQLKTQYDGGYSAETPIIIEFWKHVHEMSLDDQKKLLFFVTGSFRAPIGGLSQLNFIISRNGPDSNRLPTSHTCFNVLLLPEYSNVEKMKKFLSLAIENLEGFGLF